MTELPTRQLRKDWMITEGAAMTTLTGHETVDMLTNQDGPTLAYAKYWDEQVSYPEANALDLYETYGQRLAGFVSLGRQMSLNVRRGLDHVTLMDKFPEQNKAGDRHMFYSGLVDQDFTWYYGVCIATHVARELEASTSIPVGTISEMTLADWADLIDKDWFHEIMHTLARTANGVHRTFGSKYQDYMDGALDYSYSLKDGAKHFKVDGMTAAVSDDYKQLLKKPIKEAYDMITNHPTAKDSSSIGCPVARRYLEPTGSLQALEFEGLAARGIMVRREHKQRVLYQQLETPIDRMLALLTTNLRYIQDTLGTASMVIEHDSPDGSVKIVKSYEHAEPLGVFA